ncbi:MAG: hypothetical protein NC920_01840 [Candidatus Omnitrophica bacterium]|nr:hypothetical protein [Candidatus Omnitrophota bacterium]MCM8799047.1 hypothetical protein [Candidatus Omnitrophota bacterium]
MRRTKRYKFKLIARIKFGLKNKTCQGNGKAWQVGGRGIYRETIFSLISGFFTTNGIVKR